MVDRGMGWPERRGETRDTVVVILALIVGIALLLGIGGFIVFQRKVVRQQQVLRELAMAEREAAVAAEMVARNAAQAAQENAAKESAIRENAARKGAAQQKTATSRSNNLDERPGEEGLERLDVAYQLYRVMLSNVIESPLGAARAGSLDEAPRQFRGWEWQHLRQKSERLFPVTLHGHENHVVSVAIDPSVERIVSVGRDGKIRVHDLITGATLAVLKSESEPLTKQYLGAGFDARGERIVSLSRERGLEIWDWSRGTARQLVTLPAQPQLRSRLGRSPNGRQFAVACEDQAVYLVNVPDRETLGGGGGANPLVRLDGPDAKIRHLSFDAEGSRLVVGSSDAKAYLWDTIEQKPIATLIGHADVVTSAAFHPRVPLVLTASKDGSLRVWRRESGDELAVVQSANGLSDVAVSPDGSRAYTTGADGSVRVWEIVIGGDAVAENSAQPVPIRDVALRELVRIGGHGSEANCGVLSADGTCYVTGGGDFLVRVWDTVATPVRLGRRDLPAEPKGYTCFRAASTGSRAAISVDGRLDDLGWQGIPWSDDFGDIEGDYRIPPRFRTRVKMAWDDEHFFIGAELEEPHVWGTLTRRDSVIFYDNDFEVFIDPDGDGHQYGEFEMNALNTGWDLYLDRPYKDRGNADDGWTIDGIRTAVFVDGTLNDPSDIDRGWSLEIAIPWSSLSRLMPSGTASSPPRDGDDWRVNFSRVEWWHEVVEKRYRRLVGRAEDNWVWSPQAAINMHRPETWGAVRFSTRWPADGTTARIVPVRDPAWPARSTLYRLYYAMHDFRARHHRWARNLEELPWQPDASDSRVSPPEWFIDEDGFQAHVRFQLDPQRMQKWNLRQDARCWRDEPLTGEMP
ncbi:MAG: hypothetical protein FJ295_07835 [Planctomycetes bacterium]|nr:hypothetical protein [Planctomycetota bacterium]